MRQSIHNSGNSNIASSTSLFGGHDLGDSHKGVIRLWGDIEDAEKDPKSSVCTNVLLPRLRGFIWYKTPLWYYRFLFMWLSRMDRDPFFLCVFSAFNPDHTVTIVTPDFRSLLGCCTQRK